MYPRQRGIEKYCLKLSSGLMPDVATIALSDSLSDLQNSNDIHVKILFDDLKKEFEHSLEESRFTKNYVTLLKRKIENVTLETLQFSPRHYVKENYEVVSIYLEDFPKNYLELLKNYKKTLNSYAGFPVSPQIL